MICPLKLIVLFFNFLFLFLFIFALVEDGSMKLYQSTNSLATSMAMSRGSSIASLGSSNDDDDVSQKSREVTRL